MVSQRLAKNFEKVVAFEPCQESFEVLSQEAPPNVTALLWAVSDTNDEITLYEASRSIRTGQLVSRDGLHWGPLEGERKIPAMTLDSFVGILGKPDFIKIDTEGHEVQIVKGGLNYLATKPRLVIEIHHKESGEEIRDLLPQYDFQRFDHSLLRPSSPIRQEHYWLVGGIDVDT